MIRRICLLRGALPGSDKKDISSFMQVDVLFIGVQTGTCASGHLKKLLRIPSFFCS